MELDETKRSSLCNSFSDFSMNNLKFRLKFSDLKGNLSPKHKKKRNLEPKHKKYSSLKKEMTKSVKGKHMIMVKIRKDDISIDKLLEKAFNMRKSHFSLKKLSKKMKEKNISQETNITNLNTNKVKCQIEEKVLEAKIKRTNKLRAKSEEKAKSIASYCVETKYKSDNINQFV